jgi:hypothetical protein
MKTFYNTTRTIGASNIPAEGETVNFTDYSETRLGMPEGTYFSGTARVINVHFHGQDQPSCKEQWVDVQVRMDDTGHWVTFRAVVI